MMYINIKPVTEDITLTWHIGERLCLTTTDLHLVESIQADGDELEYIKSYFCNLPFVTNKRVVIWFGDDARFIAGNL